MRAQTRRPTIRTAVSRASRIIKAVASERSLVVAVLGLSLIGSSAAYAQSNPSVGTNGSTAPTSSTQIGTVDGSGNLQPASSANPIPTSSSGFSGSDTPNVTAVSHAQNSC